MVYWFILFQMRNDLSFVVQELFCDIEIFSSRLRLTDHDLFCQSTRSSCQKVDAVGEKDRFINIMSNEQGGKFDLFHYIQIPLVHRTLCQHVQSGEWFVQKRYFFGE